MVLCPRKSIPLLSVSEEHECGDASNVELCCQVSIVVYVHFREDHFLIKFLGESPDDWCHSVARSTPVCPEVDDNRFSLAQQFGQVSDGYRLDSSSHTRCPISNSSLASFDCNRCVLQIGLRTASDSTISSREPASSILPSPMTRSYPKPRKPQPVHE